jgi:Ca-activated chloride channel family protein
MIAFVFADPLWLALLALAPLWWAFDRARQRTRQATPLPWLGPRHAQLTPHAADRQRSGQARLCGAFAIACLALALARPQWGEPVANSAATGADVVVCLDVSRSMRARDVSKDRAAFARAMLRNYSKAAVGDRVALVLFAGDAVLRAPLTADLDSIAQIADASDELDVQRGGTDLSSALEVALLALVGSDHGAVVLLTDGDDQGGKGLAAAQRCAAQGVAVHCIAIGGPRPARIPIAENGREDFLRDADGRAVETAPDEAALAAIAAATGGVYARAEDGDLDALVALRSRAIQSSLREAKSLRGELAPPDRFAWLLGVALLAMVAHSALRRSADAVRA